MNKLNFLKTENKIINEQFYSAKFNGLNVIHVPKNDFNGKYAVYATKYGSVNNKFNFGNNYFDVPAGIAHFLEHKMFEKEDGDAFAKYAKTGASANAYTSFDVTAYLFSCTENFYESLEILVNLVNTPWFTEQTVQKEMGIIGQEIGMILDRPNNSVFYNLLECLFVNHPVRVQIAGSSDSISKITPELLYTCYNAFYNPANMVLVLSGNIDTDKAIDVLSKNMNNAKPQEVKNIFDEEPKDIFMAEKTVKMPVSKPIFEIGIKDNIGYLTGKPLVKHNIISGIILDVIASRSNPFYARLYESGLINSKFSAWNYCRESYGMFAFSGESDEPDKVACELRKEIEKLCKSGVSTDDFVKFKNKSYGHWLNSFDNVEEIADEYMDCYLRGVTPLDTFDIYSNLNINDINDELKWFDLSKMAVSTVLPSDKQKGI